MAKRKGPTPKGGRPPASPACRRCLYCARPTAVGYGQSERENSAQARLPHSPDMTTWAPLCDLTRETMLAQQAS